MESTEVRLQKLQGIADTLVEKLRLRIDREEPETMNPQAIKHITGMLKDLRDIQLTRLEDKSEGISVTVVWEEELKQYGG